MKKLKFLSLFLALTTTASFSYADELEDITVPHMEPEAVITYEEALNILNRKDDRLVPITPEDIQIAEIIRITSKAVLWADQLQANVPEAERHQVWRRIDRLGHEATPTNPMKYNAHIINTQYEEAMSATPQAMRDIFISNDPLPPALPEGITMADAIIPIRQLNNVYSRASRWINLSPLRFAYNKDRKDYRPFIQLHTQIREIESLLSSWETTDATTKTRLVESVANACPIIGKSKRSCASSGRRFLNGSSAAVTAWFHGIYDEGLQKYNKQFTVQIPHPGVDVTHNGEETKVTFHMLNIPDTIFEWIKEHVYAAWNFPGAVVLDLQNVTTSRHGVVMVDWQPGALPHVNGIGGDTITMDTNTALWLEQTQIVMAHEFGHVIGYSDCYSEFWDSDEESFVYYVIDETNRMCALSGETLPLHRDTLLAGFNNGFKEAKK